MSAFIAAQFDNEASRFALVYQALDHHKLRVVPVSSNEQQQEHNFDGKTKISSLAWCALPQQKKRRKQAGTPPTNDNLDVIVLGTHAGQLLVFSPAQTAVISTFKLESSAKVSSLTPTSKPNKLRGIQTDGSRFELTLNPDSVTQLLPTTLETPQALISLNNDVEIIGNTTPHLVKSNEVEISYMGFASQILQILRIDETHFAAIGADDRQVLVYNIENPQPINFLVCPNTSATFISCSPSHPVISAVSEDGKVHIFDNVLTPPEKSRKRKASQTAPKFSIDVALKPKNVAVAIAQTIFTNDFLTLVWPEQGSYPVFDKVQWLVNNSTLTEDVHLVKQPSAPTAREHLVAGKDAAAPVSYTEQKSHVTSGDNIANLDDDESLADRLEALEKTEDVISLDPEDQEENEDLENGESKSVSQSQRLKRRQDLVQQLAQPGSFATLLNQALNLNDKQLLEICLEEKQVDMIKSSIMKLEPQLAASLLEHLASSMARNSNRSAKLMQWIRWTVVIHGTYLVTLPNLLRTLASLHSSLTMKANTLPKLLALQGRLELLEEQLELRSQLANLDVNTTPDVVYDESALIVNGEEDMDMDSE